MKMNNLLLKNLVFLLLISLNAFAQDGKFTFTLSSSVNTSAGVFNSDGTLVRTLWNNERYASGTYTKIWDGKDDLGMLIASHDASYQIKILTNNVNYAWQGTLGNTSDNMTGASKHRGYYHCMRGLAFGPKYGYFCTGYSEGSPSIFKFKIETPNQKINILNPISSTADVNYVVTDGTKVYWGAFDASNANKSFVFATNASNDEYITFVNGEYYTPLYRDALPVISFSNSGNNLITGLAVQQSGNFLFVARSGMDQLQVLNKNTGAILQNLTYLTPRGLSVDADNNLWMASGINTVAKYTVNNDGTLSGATLTLSGLLGPLATQVSSDGNSIGVADGSSSQQVKFFNNTTGAATNTIGVVGGYANDATVTDNKFYFSDINGSGSNQYNKQPFIAYQPDGSFWVNDPGNFRVQHYNGSGTFVNRIMSMGASYYVYADKNNISKVFEGFLEFEVDYAVQNLTGTTGWVLKKNWGAGISVETYEGSPTNQTTLSNGRTYGFLRKRNWTHEIVEFPSSGKLRFTGTFTNDLANVICSDGSKQSTTQSGDLITVKRYPLTGFDGLGNPIWSTVGEFLAAGTVNNVEGSPVTVPNSQIFSTTTDKVVFFNPKAWSNNAGPVFSTGTHLGVMKKGSTNKFLFQTEKSTHRNYEGVFPNSGWFDVGNMVNDYAGGNVNIVDRNIITSYHGEFWQNGQTNKYNHYYDNGLAISQFGITRTEATEPAAAMMAGNVLTPVFVKDGNGDLYLYHGDESDHAAIHRWKITGLNTIAEQVVTIPFPSAYTVPTPDFVNLMAGLPYDDVLTNNTAGWTRDPITNNVSNAYSDLWRIRTSRQSYQKLTSNDLTIEFISPRAATNTVNRDLGTNNVTDSWKISGEIIFPPDNNVNYLVGQQYLEVLDANGKILTSFYLAESGGITTIYGNNAAMAKSADRSIQKNIQKLLPFQMGVLNGMATFTYGNYTPVSTTISDATGNWKTPKTLRIRILNNGASGPAYKQMIGIKDFKFYKDYSESTPLNKAPTANAGKDIAITIPANTVSLIGSGTDEDGTINSYTWLKISGPSPGTINTPNASATGINNLVYGIYQFQLIVTDNNEAIGIDTIQVTVSETDNLLTTNLLPSVNPANTVNGLDYKYYEGSWSVLPSFPSLNPVKTGTTNNFDLSLANRSYQYGFSFTGYINVPSDGQYTFYTTSDDGSNLYIDNILTVANDGIQHATEKSGTIGLKAGKHAITGLFFQQGGGQVFLVSYEGMGISKQTIPKSALYRVSVNAQPTTNLLPAVNPANTVNGLDYKYYEGSWNVLPSFPSLNPVKTGTTANFDLSLANRSYQYGFSFTGYINVPSDGQYTFYTTSDDGSNLFIDNFLTVENDGIQHATEKSGTIGLKAGKHEIKGLFFQQGGGQVFLVRYEGMGISKQVIPASSLYRVSIANTASRANTGDEQTIIHSSNSPVTLAENSIDNTSANKNLATPKFSVDNGFKVYPNPTKDIANLSITTAGINDKLSISVYNSLGMLVNFRQLVTTRVNTLYQMDLSGLSSGIYSIIVRFDDGQIISHQIIKGGE